MAMASTSHSEIAIEHECSSTSDLNLKLLLLDRLKAPKKSDLSRKRKVLCKPPLGKKRSSGSRALKDPKVEPSKRVKEFPNEQY